MRKTLAVAILLAVCTSSLSAQQPLGREESLAMLAKLTEKPRRAWIPRGCMEGWRLRYRASEELIEETAEREQWDGLRFRRDVTILSHNLGEVHSRRDDPSYPLDHAVMQINEHRTILWDGSRMCRFFPGADYAMIHEKDSPPLDVMEGVLAAGLIPWGVGIFTYESLAQSLVSTTEMKVQERQIVELRFAMTEDTLLVIRLDRERDLLPVAYSIYRGGELLMQQSYSEPSYMDGVWAPTRVTTNWYDISEEPAQLASYDSWSITSIKITDPPEEAFAATAEPGDLVKYKPKDSFSHVWYQQSGHGDISAILQDKLRYDASGEKTQLNCAALALCHIVGNFGKLVESDEVEQVALAAGERTSLLDLGEMLSGFGLYGSAIRTDIEGLRKLPAGRVILYLNESRHYVVLDRIENDQAWLIDLSGMRFYYAQSLQNLALQWSDGVALVVSDKPATLLPEAERIDDIKAAEMLGSTGGGFGYFSCSAVVQPYETVYCDPSSVLCDGRQWEFEEVWGCVESVGPATCTGTAMPRGIYTDCHNPTSSPLGCLPKSLYLVLQPVRGCIH